MKTQDIFKKKLEELRKSKGITQKDLAKDLGVSRTTIGYYESGERLPDIETAVKIADYFDITCDELIRGIKTENVDINKKLGLSEVSIAVLEMINNKNEDNEIQCLNWLICNIHFIQIIVLFSELYMYTNTTIEDMAEEYFKLNEETAFYNKKNFKIINFESFLLGKDVTKYKLIKTFEKIIDIISSDDQTRSQLICNSVKELNEKIEKQSKKVEEEINNIISQLKQ